MNNQIFYNVILIVILYFLYIYLEKYKVCLFYKLELTQEASIIINKKLKEFKNELISYIPENRINLKNIDKRIIIFKIYKYSDKKKIIKILKFIINRMEK